MCCVGGSGPSPGLGSEEYAEGFEEVKRLGGDVVHTSTDRTFDQTQAAIFWGYDGTPHLGVPPRLYNQITMVIGKQLGSNVVELARLLALVNVSMADAAIACWESKYYYQFWRPVTGIREAGEGTDSDYWPFGAQATNLTGPSFTPPFPSYPSGHATFGGALFQILRHFYGTDEIAFTLVSDELNGENKDNTGHVRPYAPRSFANLSDAEQENGQSRIYLGIHWSFDKTDGIAQGRRVADYVFRHAFAPARGRER